MSKHTPTPWHIIAVRDCTDEYEAFIAEINLHLPDALKHEDVDFIMRAVNSHDTLRRHLQAAVDACKAWVDYMDKLERSADPDDPLVKMRRELHGRRVEMTRAAIAGAEKAMREGKT